jgi:Ca2+-binding EF-hand superfamily protein
MKLVVEVEGEVKTATNSAAPLLAEEGAALRLARQLRCLREALKEDTKVRGVSQEALFEELCGKAAGGAANSSTPSEEGADTDVSTAATKLLVQVHFTAFLKGLPEKLKRDDIIFSEEVRQNIFKHLDTDIDGHLSLVEFQRIFQERCMCVHNIAITDSSEIRASKTLRKLDVNDVVETLGNAQVNESGVTRAQCRHIASDVIGWVTMKGNQGTVYFEPCAEYGSFLASMDTIMVATASSANKVATLVMAASNADVQAMSSWA